MSRIYLQVSPNYLLRNVRANVVYTTNAFNPYTKKTNRCNSSLFVNNGNIYCNFRDFEDCKEIYVCCSIIKLKKFITSTNIKNFMSFHRKAEKLELIADLYECVINCGFTRKIKEVEYYEAEQNIKSDMKNRYKFEDFKFVSKGLVSNSYPGDVAIQNSRDGFEIALDMISQNRKQPVPEFLKNHITYYSNNMLEENILNIDDVWFLLRACIDFTEGGTLYKHYRVEIIMINKNKEELQKKRLYICCQDNYSSENVNDMEMYFKNELFPLKENL